MPIANIWHPFGADTNSSSLRTDRIRHIDSQVSNYTWKNGIYSTKNIGRMQYVSTIICWLWMYYWKKILPNQTGNFIGGVYAQIIWWTVTKNLTALKGHNMSAMGIAHRISESPKALKGRNMPARRWSPSLLRVVTPKIWVSPPAIFRIWSKNATWEIAEVPCTWWLIYWKSVS